MSLLDPDSDIAAIARRDRNAERVLPNIVSICYQDTLVDGETREEMFARKAYEIADAMERQRKQN